MLNPLVARVFVPGAMGAIVVGTSIARLVLIGFLFAVNCSCLFKLYKEGNFKPGINYILHVLIFASNLCYLCTWLPFVVYGILNGSTVFITYSNYCFIQNTTANIVGFLFLAMLLMCALEKVRIDVLKLTHLTLFHVFLAIFAIWLLPQVAWSVFACGTDGDEMSFKFIEDFRPVGGEGNSSLVRYKVGFMVCEVELSLGAGKRLLDKYLLVVLPVAFAITCCLMVLWMHRCLSKCWKIESQLCLSNFAASAKSGWQMAVVDLVLYANLAWQAVIRPLMLAETLKRMCDSSHYISFLDVGSHLILTISAVFAPTSCPNTWTVFRHSRLSVSVVENQTPTQENRNPTNLHTKLV